MSDLQISLIIIGLLVVAGVYLFNRMQEQRYRRRIEAAFEREKQEDALLAPKVQEPAVEPVTVDARIEPSLADPPEGAGREADAPPPEPAPTVAPRMPTAADAPRSPAVQVAGPAAVEETLLVDYFAEVLGDGPFSASVIEALATHLPGIGKPVRLEVREGPDAPWQPLPAGGADVAGPVRIAVQLVSRTGPVSEAQLARFREMVQSAASELGATATFDNEAEALDAAEELDAFCADNDVAVGLNIIPRSVTGLVGTKLRALAEASGFTLAADGTFHLRDDRGNTTLALASMDGVGFESGSLKLLRSQGVSLVLDVPRVSDGRQAFRRMTELARSFATSLDGIVVDDRRAPLDAASLERISAQIEPIQGALKARGIAPGSPLALRLFS
jgi:FtsZ-interacting cell division protein ZipA